MKTEPKLAKLSQKGGARSLYGIIKLMLASMSLKMHLADGLSELNTDNIARNLTNNDELRWWFTLADVDLLCRRIAEGYYGKFYGHFSEQEFNECLVKYCNERTDLHRNQAESNTPKPDPAVLAEVNLGYHIGEDGQLVIHERKPEKPRPPRYLYNAKGEIIGNNPAYWASFGIRHESTPEQIEEMNRSNQFQQRVCQIIDRDHCDYLTAILRATEEEKAESKEVEE